MPRALLIGPAFFGYENDILAELGRAGYDATFLDERPSNSSFSRAVLRMRPSLVAARIERYYRDWARQLAAVELDLVLVIKAEVVPRWFLEMLREQNPGARVVFYHYDSMRIAGNCRAVLDIFDERFSFDPDDVEAEPDVFTYLPLFYTQDFFVAEALSSRRWSMAFVGTLHSDRYRLAKRTVEGMSDASVWFYVQARWYFAVVKYVTREHRSVPWSDVAFTPKARTEIASIFRNSKAVLDVPREGQAGLTMRTFEVLASGAMLVTTNPAVRQEPFYDPARIIVIPSSLSKVEAAALRAEIASVEPPTGPPPGFEAYSLREWVRRIVGQER